MTKVLPIVNAIIFFSLALWHIYWLMGGIRGWNATIPTDVNGRKVFKPGAVATFTVAASLFLFAGINLSFAGWIGGALERNDVRYAMWAIAAVFTLRAIGDFRYMGIFKRHKKSRFAKMDSWIYTPLCLILAASHWISIAFLNN